MASEHVRNYDRARTLETLCRVWEVNRDNAMTEAVKYAQSAKETHDEGLLKQAKWKRDSAEWFDERLKRDRAELARLRGEL